MSQAASGEAARGEDVSPCPRQLFQQPFQAPGGANIFPSGQGRAQFGTIVSRLPVKPTNPHMSNGYPYYGPVQHFSVNSSHTNAFPHQMHMNQMRGFFNPNMGAVNFAQKNNVGNRPPTMQFFDGGNSINVPVNQQNISNSYYMNQYQYVANGMNANTFISNHSADINNYMENMNCYPQTAMNNPLNSNMMLVHQQSVSEGQINPSNDFYDNDNNANSTSSPENTKDPTNESIEDDMETTVHSSNPEANVVENRCPSAVSMSIPNAPLSAFHGRSVSRDSFKSEAAESTCSTLSSESVPDHTAMGPNTQVLSQQHQNIVRTHLLNNCNANFQGQPMFQNCEDYDNMCGYVYNQTNIINHNANAVPQQHAPVQQGQPVHFMHQYNSINQHNMPPCPVNFMGNVPTQVNTNAGAPASRQNIHNMRMPLFTNGPRPAVMVNNHITGHSYSKSDAYKARQHSQTDKYVIPGQRPSRPLVDQVVPPNLNGVHANMLSPVVVVPFGWKRFHINGQIVYVSPCGSELRNMAEVCLYLTKENTCKCGLQCPLRVESVFCFDPKMPHRPTMPNELSSGEAVRSCNHRRKLNIAFTKHLQKQAKKEDGRKKRKRKEDSPEALCPGPISGPANSGPSVEAQFTRPAGESSSATIPCDKNLSSVGQGPGSSDHPQNRNLMPVALNQKWNQPGDGTEPMTMSSRMMAPNQNMQGMANVNFNNQYYVADSQHYSSDRVQEFPNTNNFQNQMNSMPCDAPYMVHGMRPTMGSMMPRHPVYPFPNPANRADMANNMPMGVNIPPQFMHQQQMNPPMRMPGPNFAADVNQMMAKGYNCGSGPGIIQYEKNPTKDNGEKRRRTSFSRPKKKLKSAVNKNSSTETRNSRPDNSNSTFGGPGPPNAVLSSGPSFMDDPNGYLAQQTVLLNNTMSEGGVGQFSPQEDKKSLKCVSSSFVTNKSDSSITGHMSKIEEINLTSQISSTPISTPSTAVPLISNVNLTSQGTQSGASSISPRLIVSTANTEVPKLVSQSVHSSFSEEYSAVESKNSNESKKNIDKTLSVTKCSSSDSEIVPSSYCKSDSPTPIQSISYRSNREDITVSSSVKNELCPELVGKSQSTAKISEDINIAKGSESDIESMKKSELEILDNDLIKADIKTDEARPDSLSQGTPSRCSSIGLSVSSLSSEAANKPLSPGPAESNMSTQSPLEMVQNIVSSIPVPESSEDLAAGSKSSIYQYHSSLKQDQFVSTAKTVPQQQFISSTSVMSIPASNVNLLFNNNAAGTVLQGGNSVVVHAPPGSLQQCPIVTTNNVVVVTSPFNSKANRPTTTCTNVGGTPSVMGLQNVPSVQLQSTIPNVTHQIAPQVQHIQPVQPVQPVVQLVSPFTAMQTPVIIQNGNNIVQTPNVLSGHGGVIGSASIIPSAPSTILTGQQLVTVETPQNIQSSQILTPKVNEHFEAPGSAPIITAVSTPATTPTTPHSTLGSETPPSGGSSGSSGGGRKKRRKRNTSTPQGQPSILPQQNIIPTIIMGKQIQQVVSGSHLPQVATYQAPHMATVAAISNNPPLNASSGTSIVAATGQQANAINVVQMVGGALTGALPIQVQQPQTILVSSTPAAGVFINQLTDGTFISTDPNTGVSYPVQLQLSGSQIVGISPPNINTSRSNVVASISVRQPPLSQANTIISPPGTKLINISPSSQGNALVNNIFNVPANQPILPQSALTIPSIAQPIQSSTESNFTHQAILTNKNSSVVSQKTTTIVAQRTTVLTKHDHNNHPPGTHSSVSTQTSGVLRESDVTSSDCVASNNDRIPSQPISPSHQSAEITTTKQDEDAASTPESVCVVSPPSQSSPTDQPKKPNSHKQDLFTASSTGWS